MSRVPLPPPEPLRFTRLAEIARGGMGTVELARVEDGRLAGRVVAIKRLHANIADDPRFVDMFLDEAWLTSSLRHPNVVEVATWGTDERGMFLAIEAVPGVSLARLLKESKQNQEPFAERTVANVCSQICAGLTAAHHLRDADGALLGLVHRDLAPGNVLVSFDGLVKIIDFGIAKAEQRISHTRTGELKGKPGYMAPEQIRHGKIDQRADVFSFGVMMFELLTGRRPWKAKSAFDVMMQIINTPPPDLAELRPALDPEFIAIVQKCIEKEPEARFSSAAEIQTRLDAWRAQKGFVVDDQRSLASFVERNSAAQIRWFESALRGDIARAEALTFKELEEKIDADRDEPRSVRKRPSAPLRSPTEKVPESFPPPTPRPEPAWPPKLSSRSIGLDERIRIRPSSIPPPPSAAAPLGLRPPPAQAPSAPPSFGLPPRRPSSRPPHMPPPPAQSRPLAPPQPQPRSAAAIASTRERFALMVALLLVATAAFVLWKTLPPRGGRAGGSARPAPASSR